MNRKGFTLIELLAVIVVLALILIISFPSLTNVFKSSKLKNEEIFVGRLSQTIDSYVSLNSSEISFSDFGDGRKEGEESSVHVYKGTIEIQNLFDDKLITESDYINPGNKDVPCNKEAEIEVYRDSDYVYCHKIKKDSLICLSNDYKDTLGDDYVIDTCTWERVEER